MTIIGQVTCIAMDAIHYMWNCTHMQLMCNSITISKNNYHVIIMQLVYNYMVMSCWCHFSLIHQNLTQGINYGKFWVNFFFEILISTVHYDCSFIMVLNCDMWNSQNLPCGILIENWKINKQKSINIYVGQYIGIGG
jgi:hypothetical protein